MKLKITATNWVLFEWEVEEVIVPVKDWEVGILPWHALYSGIIKWWLCKFKESKDKWKFIKEWEYSVVSVWDWVVYTNWEEVRIAVSEANSTIDVDEDELIKMKEKLEKEMERVKNKWSVEEIEKALLSFNKIIADLELKRLKKKAV